ncbi:Endonuclease/exonuclease/phosphatase [Lasiosphaeria miniovina]|uniref:Endonuclease/exonuclease/phosphatase n=1 Tax=Lasiosphaeria miniovina TaxID=1954250 RepID=A0AA40E9Q3_9PEZI|nr:Endonuclease/exonuclease/phosphatase [Lasiosphaeria miniovina]KAK0727548.1 Endonuclease/exonuclease/phosphatase [Lasiosphaeria miniovina]
MESSQQPPPPGSTTSEPVDLATTNPYSLHQAVYARRAEYVRPHRIRVKIGTWNVAACPGTDKDLAGWFVSGRGLDAALTSLDLSDNPVVEKDGPVSPSTDAVGEHAVHLVGGDKVGLYVLGLQEVVDLNTPAYMARVYAADHGPVGKWRDALDSALPPGYQLIVAEQMSGILLFVYASPDVVPTISNVSSTSVGTGVLGYLGNKGAVVTRLILGDSTRMLFVNCHLASGNEASYVERRIWDVGTILSRAQFKPASIAGVSEDDPEKIGDEDFAFWLGDLNFRLDGIPSDDIRHLLMLHSRGEYDLSKRGLPREDSLEGEGVVVSSEGSEETTDREPTASSSRARAQDDDDSEFLPDPDDFVPDPHEDPASLQATLDSLLPHDQLKRVIRQRKIFHDGWREGPITFLPTYKYDVGTVGLFDSSEKRRAPSWCDRILYRSRKDKEDFEKKIKEEEDARKKDEEMRARGIDHAAEEDEVLFDYGPDPDDDNQPQESPGLDYDEYDDGEEGNVDQIVTKEGFNDKIHLDIYTSHQRITSSDHKPISSVFTLDYDAVVPELKAKVHAEVARELDRAENEGRPGITVVVDHPNPHSSEQSDRHGDPPEHLVDFGEVRFMKKETSTLTLANTGRVPATFLFVEKPTTGDPDNSTLLQWLTASFIRPEPSGDEPESFELGKEVTLEPGETVQALLEASVSEISHARMLNDGEASLEEVLVLRVTDGRDHFIPIRGTWAPTCIGRSIDELIRIPEGGIRKLAKALLEKKVRAGPIPYDLDVHSAAPRELFRFTEAIETLTERALADEQMVEDCRIPKDAGWPFEESTWKSSDGDSRASLVVDIIDALDHDRPISDAFAPETSCIQRLEAVGEALLLFLRGLTDGVITTSIWDRIEQAALPSLSPSAAASRPPPGADFEADKTTILDILSTTPNHNICFVFLTATLAKIVAELSPLSRAELEALKADSGSRVMGVLGRRSLSFRRGGTSPAAEAAAAFERRQTRERRFAEVFGRAICRAPVPERERDKKLVEDRERAIVELFLRRRGDS